MTCQVFCCTKRKDVRPTRVFFTDFFVRVAGEEGRPWKYFDTVKDKHAVSYDIQMCAYCRERIFNGGKV